MNLYLDRVNVLYDFIKDGLKKKKKFIYIKLPSHKVSSAAHCWMCAKHSSCVQPAFSPLIFRNTSMNKPAFSKKFIKSREVNSVGLQLPPHPTQCKFIFLRPCKEAKPEENFIWGLSIQLINDINPLSNPQNHKIILRSSSVQALQWFSNAISDTPNCVFKMYSRPSGCVLENRTNQSIKYLNQSF